MKKLTLLLFLLSAAVASAIMITLVTDLDTYLSRGKEIVVAKCLSKVPDKPNTIMIDGLYLVEIEVIQTLKGSMEKGNQTIATIYPMAAGQTYFLYTLGGDKFYATAELSVVEVPTGFNWESNFSNGKPLREQISSLFKARLAHVKKELSQKSSLTLSPRDKDRQALWARLKSQPSPDGVMAYLNTQLSSETRTLLSDYKPPFRSDNTESTLGHAFIQDLNRILRNGPIYDARRFAEIKLSAETQDLLKQNLQGADLVRLNIALLLDANPAGLWRDHELEREKPLLETATGE